MQCKLTAQLQKQMKLQKILGAVLRVALWNTLVISYASTKLGELINEGLPDQAVSLARVLHDDL